jgi:glyceraldehyde 3-phosphate dehydrogenase
MAVRVAINGFGRNGRMLPRIIGNDESIEIVAINDLYAIEDLAYVLKYDSTFGRLGQEVSIKGEYLVIGERKIRVFAEKDPANLPWKSLGVEVVAECSGRFTSREKAVAHINAGATKVLISAPAENPDGTFVLGVNGHLYNPKSIISSPSAHAPQTASHPL